MFEATLIIDGKETNLGPIASKGKMVAFRLMISNGQRICGAIDQKNGEFTFVWDKKSKVWEFFSSSGAKIGFLKVDICQERQIKKSMQQYRERLAAYDAQCRADAKEN